MFSTTLEYALRAVTWLAARPDEAATTQRIAEATQMPEDYLSKVLQQLVRAGVLDSQRGRNGGFRLARDPAAISMLEVVTAVDPIPRITTCPLGLREHGVKLCPLHRRLDDAYQLVEQAFRSTTLDELISGGKRHAPLCDAKAGLEVLHAR
jgi:Rrf2 family transcriptional regulator, nitric oxide-sensitive transcriptional repressor